MGLPLRLAPLATALACYSVCGALKWLDSDWVRWAFVILIAATISFASANGASLVLRVWRGLWIGFTVSLFIVGLGLAYGWIVDRPHFFDDGGPGAALILVEFYVGLPLVGLAVVLNAIAPLWLRFPTTRAPR